MATLPVNRLARFRKWYYLCVAAHLLLAIGSTVCMVYAQYLWPWGPWNIYPFGPLGHPDPQYYQAPFFGSGGASIIYAATAITLVSSFWSLIVCTLGSWYARHRVARCLEVFAFIMWCTALGVTLPKYQLSQSREWQNTIAGVLYYADTDEIRAAVQDLMNQTYAKAHASVGMAGGIM